MTDLNSGSRSLSTACVIVGGRPAGMVLGLLLARRGVRVQVLEMHGDFERDFRGDTIHPAAMELLDRIGLAAELLKLGHGKLRAMRLVTPERTWDLVRFTRSAPRSRWPPTAGPAVSSGCAGSSPNGSRQRSTSCGCACRKRMGDVSDEGALYSSEGQFGVVFERESEWQAGYVIPKGGRREPAVRAIQRVQGAIQERIVGETLRHKEQFVLPWPVRLLLGTPILRDSPARMLAFGHRPYRLERADERLPF